MRIALYGKSFDSEYDCLISRLLEVLKESNVKLLVYEHFSSLVASVSDVDYEMFDSYSQLVGKADMLFSFGGDGTVLDSLPLVRDSEIPVFGINMGRLGFLSSVSANEAEEAVRNILKGNYMIDSRFMLQVVGDSFPSSDVNYALNEISVLRSEIGGLIVVTVYVDDLLVNTYWADGLILATPTGSTAYSMSAGGPIMAPDTKSFVITPVSPHNLSVRPVVIPDKSVIRIKVDGRCNAFSLGLDSRKILVDKSLELEVRKTDFCFNMVKMQGKDFFTAMRNKLLWGNDVRN